MAIRGVLSRLLGGGKRRPARPEAALPRSKVDEFLYFGEFLFVQSSNVAVAQYFPEDQKLMVEFLNGSAYLYSGVGVEEARDFAEAPSKGEWIWDHLRKRGSKWAHRKAYLRVR
jgi:KTSC domain